MPHEQFHCPGELHPISPSVHFARLRAGYFACKNCSHQQEKGMLELVSLGHGFHQIPTSQEQPPKDSARSSERTFRTDQAEYFEALIHKIADWFWAQQAFVPAKDHYMSRLGSQKTVDFKGNNSSTERNEVNYKPDFLPARIVSRPQSPTLVVGFDGDLKTADRLNWAIERLNLLGLKIIDTGKTPLACLEYLKINLEADGYLSLHQVTAPHHTLNLECLSKSGKSPLESSPEESLTKRDILSHREQRTSGNWRTHSGLSTYEASFLKRLHGLRPLKICFQLSNPYHQVLLQQLSEEWPCKSCMVPSSDYQHYSSSQQMALQIRKENADLGCRISPDGKHVTIWDETGNMLTRLQLVELLAGYLIQEYPDDFISIDEKHHEIFHRLNIYQDRIKPHQHQSHVFSNPKCRLLFNARNELWHKDPELRRDGFLTLIHIIKKLSEKDTTLSELTQFKTI